MKTIKKSITIEKAFKASNSSANQAIKQKFVGQHVYCNVGTLCGYVVSKSYTTGEDNSAPFSVDDIENFYSYPEYNGQYASFEGGNDEQRQEEIDRLKEVIESYEDEDDNEEEETYEGHSKQIQQINNEIEELENLESEPQEIFEWWAISDYLFDRLKEQGQCVVDAGSCYVWGRCTIGQAILLDGCISRICANMEILKGQTNSWA